MSGMGIQIPDWVGDQRKAFGFFDDFLHYTSTDLWTSVLDTGSTVADTDANGGKVILTCDGDVEDAAMLPTTNEIFKIVANKPVYVETRLKITEAATNDADVVFGVSDLVTVDLLVDAEAGVATTFDGALIFKVGNDGGTNQTQWQVASSNGTTQTVEATDHAHADEEWTTLGILLRPVNATDFEITYFVDLAGGTDLRQMRPLNSNPRTPDIKHTKLIANMDLMHAVVGVKNGGGAAEVLNVDYMLAWQRR